MKEIPRQSLQPARRARGAALVLGVALALLAGPASALPITLNVDSGQSSIDVDVSASILSASDTAQVSGSMQADLDLGLPSFEAVSGAFGLSDLAMSASLFGNGFNINSEDLVADFTGGPVAGSQLDAITFEFDLAGFMLSLNSGSIFGDTFGSLVGASTFDFDLTVDPFEFVLPSTVMTVTATPAGGSAFDILAEIPLSDSLTLLTADTGLPVDVTLGLDGDIVMTGLLVPEPGTLLLGLAALGGLAVQARRARR